MWDETVANRGSSEVASCLSHFFETNRTGAKSLVSYSDGCGGQNKNLTVLGLYSDLHLRGVYDTLDHKFLTRGHTFLRNDSDFAQIERRKSSAVVYLPSDWCKVLGEANRRNPFQVVQMKQTQFFNYKQHIEGKYTGRHIATGGATFLDVHWMNFGWGSEINPSLNRSVLVHHPQRSVDEGWILFVGILEENKDTEGESWGRFFGGAIQSAYRTIGQKGERPERDGSYARTFTTTRLLP